MEKRTEIYGIRTVIEAINSKKDIDKVFIQTGLKGKLIAQLESLSGIVSPEIIFSFILLGIFPFLARKILSFY